MPRASRSSVAQLSVSASQLIKLIKSVSSLVLEKVITAVCVFLRKAPTKKFQMKIIPQKPTIRDQIIHSD